MGAGVSGLLLSWWLRLPIITAWSAPGTALLLSLFPGISMPEVVGAYLTAAAIVIAIGVTGCFERIVAFIPKGIAAGMMAGILFQFGVQVFRASVDAPSVVFAMLAAYLIGKRLWPRYAIVIVAVTGFAVALAMGKTNLQVLGLAAAHPVFVAPQFNLGVFFSFTLPLVLVSLTGQYLPGMAVLQLAGYRVPSRAVVTGTGLASLLMACFGGITIVLAAITAALCTGKDAHQDPAKRYVAGIANGVFYLIGGTFAGTIVQVFTAFPSALIAALAGLALIGAIVSNVRLMVDEGAYVEPSVITFLATASGMTLFGLGAAFWGVVFGMASYWLFDQPRKA
ncbi:benzoate transporter [Comamonas phosphati]|nr:benzoate transporter [Comamonas phosphati]